MKLINYLGLSIAFATVACSGNEKKEVKQETAPSVPTVATNGLKIAYYYTDSLKKQFTFFKKEDDRLTAKGKAFESQLMARQKALDGLKMRFQERYQAGTASAEEMMNLENEIKRKEQQFMTFQQTQGAALETETNESLESLTKKIEAAGKKYCEKYGIDLLLIHGQGGQINFINKKMDVTRSFIDYLNYEQQQLEKDMGK